VRQVGHLLKLYEDARSAKHKRSASVNLHHFYLFARDNSPMTKMIFMKHDVGESFKIMLTCSSFG